MAESNNIPAVDALVGQLTVANLRGASGIATRGKLSSTPDRVLGISVLPARSVYDPVTGQVVTVVGIGTAYLSPSQLQGVETNV